MMASGLACTLQKGRQTVTLTVPFSVATARLARLDLSVIDAADPSVEYQRDGHLGAGIHEHGAGPAVVPGARHHHRPRRRHRRRPDHPRQHRPGGRIQGHAVPAARDTVKNRIAGIEG